MTQPPPTPRVTVPTPTALTLRMRSFLPWQLWRFALINLKMLRMIFLSHPKRVPPG